MAGPNASAASLIDLPFRDPETGDVIVVVETPKGSRSKFKYEPRYRALRLGSVLADGLSFPYDFGFVPSTLGEDGDPLDVLLFLDHAVPAGCIVTSRLIGVLEVRQRKGGGEWKRNDRFLGVATSSLAHQDLHKLTDLRPRLLDEIEAFFRHYVGFKGDTLEILGRQGPERAEHLLQRGAAMFEANHE